VSDYGKTRTVRSFPVQAVKTLLFLGWCLMFIKHYQEAPDSVSWDVASKSWFFHRQR